jgi:ribosomal protein L5
VKDLTLSFFVLFMTPYAYTPYPLMSRLHAHGKTVCVYDSLLNTGKVTGPLQVSLHCTEKTLASDPKKGIRLLKLMSFLTGIYPESAQAENHHASFHLRKNDLLGFTLSLKGEYAESFLSRCIHTFFPLDPTFQGIPLSGLNLQGDLSFTLNSLDSCPELEPLKPFLEEGFYLQVCIHTPTTTKEEGYRYLTERQFPLLPEKAVQRYLQRKPSKIFKESPALFFLLWHSKAFISMKLLDFREKERSPLTVFVEKRFVHRGSSVDFSDL